MIRRECDGLVILFLVPLHFLVMDGCNFFLDKSPRRTPLEQSLDKGLASMAAA
jgi:hypothetical protein